MFTHELSLARSDYRLAAFWSEIEFHPVPQRYGALSQGMGSVLIGLEQRAHGLTVDLAGAGQRHLA